ncbi:hypothetical protein G4177_29545 [Corallococcus sp. ZKHCc1 1396]|uniref:Secreted protein n=1 Tax=Corallococcus soli TaxID=2710757 RepID=A0ABR9PWL1_9BACT|nr:hypothetical protein [Corallococcus soli]MBE4752318.1 hypothetical protein [Corallococcus soli]
MIAPLLLALSAGCTSPSARPEPQPAPVAEAPAQVPSTPAPADRADPEAAAYTACGCGCCPGVEANGVKCVGREELQQLIAKDQADAKSPDCAMAGCTLPAKYQVCDPNPATP